MSYFQPGEQFNQDILDALVDNIAVIDQGGNIRAVNEAWKRFARENGGSADLSVMDVGVNYLAACKEGDSFSEAALAGITGILKGKLAHFTLEYPCHSPTERRWFLMNVTPLAQRNGAVIAHINITGRKLAEESLQKSEARIRRLIESNILGVFFWRGELITEANEVFLNMSGYNRQELLEAKLRWNALTPAKYQELDRAAIQTLKQRGALPAPYEKEIWRKDNTTVPILIGAAYINEAEEEGVAFVLDISERKELERRKDDFFQMVSHELKTPLSNIWILTRLLNKQLTEQGFQDTRKNLAYIEVETRQLMKLLTDVLEVSQLQAGYLLYSEERFDMNVLAREIVGMLQQVSAEHCITISGAVPLLVQGDRTRLGQVLTNLLTNAIKYSRGNDPIDVIISSDDEWLTIQVRDYGVGIPIEQQEQIFERFYRSPHGKQSNAPGFGLGLYIAREIVNRHGGTLSVTSIEGKGSTFILTLPLRNAPPGDPV